MLFSSFSGFFGFLCIIADKGRGGNRVFGQPRFKRKKAHHQIETIRIWLKFVDYRRICTYGHRQFAQKEGETTLYIEVF